MTPQQQHHRKAARIHEQASTHHNEAAKSHESGDVVAAVLHARLAYEYAAQATEHGELLDRPCYMKGQDDQGLVAPLRGASEDEVDGNMMRTLNIL